MQINKTKIYFSLIFFSFTLPYVTAQDINTNKDISISPRLQSKDSLKINSEELILQPKDTIKTDSIKKPSNAIEAIIVHKAEDYIRSSSIVHTIIRAGGLTNEEAGFKGVRMQQGDSVAVNGGMTSRGNLAAICIEALSNQNAKNKTFEVFDDETIKPNTWQKTFSNLIPDEKQ